MFRILPDGHLLLQSKGNLGQPALTLTRVGLESSMEIFGQYLDNISTKYTVFYKLMQPKKQPLFIDLCATMGQLMPHSGASIQDQLGSFLFYKTFGI